MTPKCHGIMGLIFGHKMQALEVFRIPSSGECISRAMSGAHGQDVLPVAKAMTRTEKRIVCVRCGHAPSFNDPVDPLEALMKE